MNIQHHESAGRGRFFIEDEDGNNMAEISYMVEPNNVLVVEHTEVDESLQGQNIGLQLVTAVVEEARNSGRKIVPVCSFARAVIEKKPEFADVIA